MKRSVLIPFRDNGDDHRAENFGKVWASWRSYLGMHDEIIIGDTKGAFNRSAARNEAFSRCTGDVIIIADADTLFLPDAVSQAVLLVSQLPGIQQWALPYDVYYNSTRACRFVLVEDDSSDRELVEGEYEHRITDAVSGVIVLTREAFEKVRGYDERFDGWGYEDNAFARALEVLCGKPTRLSGFVVHLWHPTSEAQNFGQPMIQHNRDLYVRYLNATTKEEMQQLVAEENRCALQL